MEASVDPDPSHPIGMDALYRAHAGFLGSFLVRLGIPRDEASDLVQDVFLIAHRKGGYVPGPAHPRTWLCAIAVRVASSHRRRRKLVLSRPEERAATLADPEANLQARQAAERVAACLDSLDFAHRSVFVLFEIEGMKGTDISQALEIPVGTVYRRLHEARRLFADEHRRRVGT